jgi:hypothetical protein
MKESAIDRFSDPEAAAEVIGDVLQYIAPDKRAVALAIAVKAEEAERAEREANGGFKFFDAGEVYESPGMHHWNCIMQLKARLAYTFIRTIRNNHSPQRAAQLLFQRHRYTPGSGYLEEYLDGLPGARRDR